MASSKKAMNIVFSRPKKSNTQPKNGRVSSLSTRSIESAKVSAGNVMANKDGAQWHRRGGKCRRGQPRYLCQRIGAAAGETFWWSRLLVAFHLRPLGPQSGLSPLQVNEGLFAHVRNAQMNWSAVAEQIDKLGEHVGEVGLRIDPVH